MQNSVEDETTKSSQSKRATVYVPPPADQASLFDGGQEGLTQRREEGTHEGKATRNQPLICVVKDGKLGTLAPGPPTVEALPPAIAHIVNAEYTRRTLCSPGRIREEGQRLVEHLRTADERGYYERMPEDVLAPPVKRAYLSLLPKHRHMWIGFIEKELNAGKIHTAADLTALFKRLVGNARLFADYAATGDNGRKLGLPKDLPQYVETFTKEVDKAVKTFQAKLDAMAREPPCTDATGRCQMCDRPRDELIMKASRHFCHGEACTTPDQLLKPGLHSHVRLTGNEFIRLCGPCFQSAPPQAMGSRAYTGDKAPLAGHLAPSQVFRCLTKGCDVVLHWPCSGADLLTADAALEQGKSPRVLCYACRTSPPGEIIKMEVEDDGTNTPIVEVSTELRLPTEVPHTQASAVVELTVRGGLRDGGMAASVYESIFVREMCTADLEAHGLDQDPDTTKEPAWKGFRRHFTLFQVIDGISVILGDLEMQELYKVDSPSIKHAVLTLLDTVRTDQPGNIRRPAAALAVLGLSHFSRLTNALTFQWHAQCPSEGLHQFILHDKGTPVGVVIERPNGSQQELLLGFYCGTVQLEEDKGLQSFVKGTVDWVYGAKCVGKSNGSFTDSRVVLPAIGEGLANHPPFPSYIVTKVLQGCQKPSRQAAQNKRTKNNQGGAVAAKPDPGGAVEMACIRLNRILDGKATGKLFFIDLTAVNQRMPPGGVPVAHADAAVHGMNAIAINPELPERCAIEAENQTLFEAGNLLMMVEVNQGGFSSPALAWYTTQLVLSAALRNDGRRYLTNIHHHTPAPAH